MSFLLDALGKADDDRRRAVVPELRTPARKPGRRSGRALKALLLLCLALISFAAGYLSRPFIEPGFSLSIERDIQQNEVAQAPLTVSSDGNQVKVPEETSVPPEARRIELSVISYSREPAARFAMLNGFVMYEGDILADGQTLVEIKPDGVVIEAEGRQYNLGLAIAPAN